MAAIFRLLFTKLTLPPASIIQGKTVLITGASTGLGREATRHAAQLGAATVILGVRSVVRGEAAKADIAASTDGKTQLLVWPIDLESFASVRAFADRVESHVTEGGHLDLAIMNAGMATQQFVQTDDGWERSLQVNVLSTALLSLRLLAVLLRSGTTTSQTDRPHLAIVSSDIHAAAKFAEAQNDQILVALNDQAQWAASQAAGGAAERYAMTKLLDLFLAEQLAELTPRDAAGQPRVVVNSLTPGFCKSDLLTREAAPWVLRAVQAAIARSVEEGSKTLLDAATQGVASHGQFLEHEQVTIPGKNVTSAAGVATKKKLWAELVELLLQVNPGLTTAF